MATRPPTPRRSAQRASGKRPPRPARARKPAQEPAEAPAPAAEAEAAVPSWVESVLGRARKNGQARAAALRIRYPEERPAQLAERLVSSVALRAGLWGAATGTLALFTLPVGLPAGVAMTLLLEAELLFALLALYGFSSAGEVGRARLFALWAGGGAVQAARSAGLKVGTDVVGRALAGSLPGRLIGRINPILLREILKRLGLSWLPRALKLWPLVGAPIGFAFDRAALKALGRQAIAALEAAPRA